MITIELYGIPRLRAGTGRVGVAAATVAEALAGLAAAAPGLAGSVLAGGRVPPEYRLSLNGDRFISDPGTPLADGDVLLLLSADAGG
jgi:sulfur-carrier protein